MTRAAPNESNMKKDENIQTDDGLLIAGFLLGEAAFGIDAQQVQEVARVGNITPVCYAPPYVVGIRNLRGRIVTVIDLRVRLGMGKVIGAPDNRILIVDWQGEPIGLLVDSVSDTFSTTAAALAPPPPNLHGVQSKNLRGVCRGGDRLVALLDLGVVLQPDDHGEQVLVGDQTAS
jgi:purine-binding chemotaxis protein CheW